MIDGPHQDWPQGLHEILPTLPYSHTGDFGRVVPGGSSISKSDHLVVFKFIELVHGKELNCIDSQLLKVVKLFYHTSKCPFKQRQSFEVSEWHHRKSGIPKLATEEM